MSDQPVAPTPDSLANFQTLSIEDVTDEKLRQGISASINLMENINRGTVAEVIVATAVNGMVTEAWADWDVEVEDGTRIQVTSTGAVQAWPQSKPSPVTWQIPKTQGWELVDGDYTNSTQ